MIRLPDWPDALLDYVNERSSAPFKYGTHDCVMFAIGAADRMMGTSLRDRLKVKWRGPKTALRALEAYGGNDLGAAVDEFLEGYNFPEVGRSYAQRGDVALIEADDLTGYGTGLAVVMQGHHIAPHVSGGLARVGLSRTRRVWAIGRAI